INLIQIMKNNNNFIIMITAIIILFHFSCNKKDEKVDTGGIVETNQIIDINCNTASGGGSVSGSWSSNITSKGLCWSKQANPDINDFNTDEGPGTGLFTSSLTKLEIGVIYFVRAYAQDANGFHYGPEISFQTLPCNPVTYGGQTYNVVQIGNQCWMAENYNYGNVINGSVAPQNNSVTEKYAYNNDTSYLSQYGGLYDWNEMMDYVPASNSNPSGVMGICPQGWHIPSDSEWKQLEMALGMTQAQANTIGWRGTNQGAQMLIGGSSGLDIVFGGMKQDINAYNGVPCDSWYWSSSDSTVGQYYRSFDFNSDQVERSLVMPLYGMSVRCIKN
ncbi:fibrobacter succinogenes major paralogous domain-containing protein, partial [candidate division KSB1 bacterium]